MTAHTATISSKSQITIPAAVRDALGLSAGDKIDFIRSSNGFEIVPRRQSVMTLHGKYSHLVTQPKRLDEIDVAIRNRMKKRFGA
jgi:antitoxin PrlF